MSAVLNAAMRTKPGKGFVQFMRTDQGKALDKFLVRTTGFSLLMRVFSAMAGFPPMPVLMMYTTGAKSGELRSTVMPYVRAGGRLYVIGSNGAKPMDPAWVHNLAVHPLARIIIGRKPHGVIGRRVEHDSDEYARVWAAARLLTPQYDAYQSQTMRKIPVVALETEAGSA